MALQGTMLKIDCFLTWQRRSPGGRGLDLSKHPEKNKSKPTIKIRSRDIREDRSKVLCDTHQCCQDQEILLQKCSSLQGPSGLPTFRETHIRI